MAQKVIIKSNKYGINLILDPEVPFSDLLKAVIEKFEESEKFFKNSKLGISFEGRKLSDAEEQKNLHQAVAYHVRKGTQHAVCGHQGCAQQHVTQVAHRGIGQLALGVGIAHCHPCAEDDGRGAEGQVRHQ